MSVFTRRRSAVIALLVLPAFFTAAIAACESDKMIHWGSLGRLPVLLKRCTPLRPTP